MVRRSAKYYYPAQGSIEKSDKTSWRKLILLMKMDRYLYKGKYLEALMKPVFFLMMKHDYVPSLDLGGVKK